MYRLATKKLSEVELEWEEISTKIDEANETIGALEFENNFLAEKTKKLEAELFQVRAQLERTSSAKLDEMVNLQKSASNRTSLGYDFSSSHIATSSTTIFVPSANNTETENNDVKNELASENIDKGKSICIVVIYNYIFSWLLFRAKFDCNFIQYFVPYICCEIWL